MDVVRVFLFLHAMGAIVAFGPMFALPLIGSTAQRHPQHAHFAAIVSEVIERRLVLPFAMLQALSGVGLIWAAGISPFANLWLALGIVLYLIAIGYATAVQAKAAERMVALTSTPPTPGPAGAPGGPSSEILATARKLQQGGLFLSGLVVVIVVLMVTKPF
jgi:uncharacterized membrane protein